MCYVPPCHDAIHVAFLLSELLYTTFHMAASFATFSSQLEYDILREATPEQLV